MVENYTKDLKESVYHGAVVSILAVGYTRGYTMLGKTLIKLSPPSLGKVFRPKYSNAAVFPCDW